ncbi:MAG TPA: hypothetical protein VJ753_02675 [Rhizomicrobium sp.]|nr:hypothetical protein [Rhizomicrobium sp.]
MSPHISSACLQIGKRVIYNRDTNPCMPEKPAFIGAIWNFYSSCRLFGVHLRFMSMNGTGKNAQGRRHDGGAPQNAKKIR